MLIKIYLTFFSLLFMPHTLVHGALSFTPVHMYVHTSVSFVQRVLCSCMPDWFNIWSEALLGCVVPCPPFQIRHYQLNVALVSIGVPLIHFLCVVFISWFTVKNRKISDEGDMSRDLENVETGQTKHNLKRKNDHV